MGAMNELIDVDAIRCLVTELETAAPGQRLAKTSSITSSDLEPLNLRARSDLVEAALLNDLPDDYYAVAAIFRRALASPGFSGWSIWPVTEAVAALALSSDVPAAFDDGLSLLAELTPRLTSEFAIRRFLMADLDRALESVMTWTAHPDAAVRRLASEGTRPFLPWAIRVRSILDTTACTVPILNALHEDESDYVRRSVANHLNDLSRQDPDLVVSLATEWLRDPGRHTRSVVRHGLRTLIKRAHPGALALMGFSASALTVSTPRLESKQVQAPGKLAFAFDVTNDGPEPANIAVDYVIHFVKANGSLSDKVFKLAVRELAPGETTRFTKSHVFRPMTTRVHHAGTHALEVQVNGSRSGWTDFTLVL
ncbi:DNA alkylation repair protein [Streptomyces nodosus]|uniref:DNA alkylation repair protein n=1 Tax=Streptomyces nodosus TaxID=40318 RepID=UPI0036E2C25C